MSNDNEEVYNLHEFADIAGVSKQTLANKINTGDLIAKKSAKNKFEIPQSQIHSKIAKEWLQQKNRRMDELKSAQEVLSKSSGFISGLKEEEIFRKRDSEE